MKIALVQMNAIIGDFQNNIDSIKKHTHQAYTQGAQLVIFPELCVCGYPPKDLALYPSFQKENDHALQVLSETLPPDIAVLVGSITSSIHGLQNTMSCIFQGKIYFQQSKTLLPSYDVFNEPRIFTPAQTFHSFTLGKTKIIVAICEDVWRDTEIPGNRYTKNPLEELTKLSANVLIAASASPFYVNKPKLRENIIKKIALKYHIPVIFVNTTGAHDSLIFDGYSFAVNAQGEIVTRLPGFKEYCAYTEIPSRKKKLLVLHQNKYADICDALCMGINDFVHKNNCSRVHFGLSGGIDSAVVAVLAQKALGAKNVHAVLMPSIYSSDTSIQDAQKLVASLCIRSSYIPIHTHFTAFLSSFNLSLHAQGITVENIQARIRGILLMAIANQESSLLLNTGNKSELAVGYCTLYGDMTGALSVIGDLFKTEVYELAAYLNTKEPYIPQSILDKTPSAELRPHQKDQDTLPAYDVLDSILAHHLIQKQCAKQIIKKGFPPQTVSKVLHLVKKSEFKRFQSAPILKISPLTFGDGRDMPIAGKGIPI
ncbi:hypothetical protein LSH36_583g02014 [Paralvinella palmiformis]|uniref:Glutamine-dependent NAD(+) synthetase n=1 Tax=Paralvinella palmiformis TaxID=53620 RepID=A0AAD9MWX2_9ANNE|nr:hypothetical protein LSH36_583g02014 [Paralvinella palmiformis]